MEPSQRMTGSARSRRDLLEILIPLALLLTAIAGALLLAYGLRLFDPTSPRTEAVTVQSHPAPTGAGAGDPVTHPVAVSDDAAHGTPDPLPAFDTLPANPEAMPNVVSVSVGASGEVVQAAFRRNVDLQKPAVGVRASVKPEAATRGEQVLCSVTASNVGAVDVETITVTDSLEGDLSASFPPTLAAGASRGRTFSWTVPPNAPDPLTRTITLYAARNGDVISDTTEVVVDLLKPAVEVGTTVSPAAIVPGETVTCTITTGNVGQVDLEAITVTDSLRGVLSSSFPPTLTVGASEQRALAWAIGSDDSLPLTRTVTVRGRGAGAVVSDTATAVVDTLKPILRIEPAVVPTTTVRGGEAAYTVTVVNAGDVAVGDVRVSDSLLGDLSRGFPRTFPPGTSQSQAYAWSCRPDVAGPLTRTVTVSGEGARQVVSDTAAAAMDLAGVTVSTSGPARARAGERVTAAVTVTNACSTGAPELVLEAIVDGDRKLAVPDACRVLAHGEACTFDYDVAVPLEDDAFSCNVEVRYRPEGLVSPVTDVAEHSVAVVSPWQKGAGIPVAAEVPALAVCPALPDLLYAGFHGGGRGVYWSGDAGLSWAATDLKGEDVFGIAVDPRECRTVYVGARRDGVMKSEDGGRSWYAASTGLERAFVYSVVVDPTDPDVLYAGTARRGVYRSDDGGATWRAWGLGSVAVPDLSVAADGGAVWAATWGDGVYRRLDRGRRGSSWRAINDGIADQHREVYGVAVDPQDDAIAFAATASGGVYRTLDGGSTWRRVLPSPRPAYAVAVDPEDGEVVYVGTAHGVYRSVLGGDPGSWESFDAGLESLAVRAVVVGRGSDVVHLGTADGAWRHMR
jgi:uncharacterized repeat protein (TIGR01451 family)